VSDSATDIAVSLSTLRKRWPDCDDAKISEWADACDANLASEWADDYVLSRACLAGSPSANEAFEREVIQRASRGIRGSTKYSAVIEEAMQRLRIRLLVDGKLASYSAKGPVAAFVRVAASRTVIDLHRASQRGTRELQEQWAPLLDAHNDPELAVLRNRHGEVLTQALRAAWAALPADDRLLLGMQLHEDCGVQQIAQLYGIHRTSAARRLVAARSRLLDACREALCDSLGSSDETVESIIRAFASSSAWVFIDGASSLFAADDSPADAPSAH
tara:strand:- start:75158 stop:75979 length:822 start_codon:yes stop_codon:yes gene_type:complete